MLTLALYGSSVSDPDPDRSGFFPEPDLDFKNPEPDPSKNKLLEQPDKKGEGWEG